MFQTLYDILFREPFLMLKYYHFAYSDNKYGCKMFFCADGKFAHGGMFDRLKGAISVYAASKVLERDFRIRFISPFQLENYLEPNLYDWRVKNGEYEESYVTSRLVFMYGEFDDPFRLLNKRRRNSHFYYGYDSLGYINEHYGTSFVWGDLYRELFKPTKYLQHFIDEEKTKLGSEYIAVHLRFMNLLGDKIEFGFNPTLPVNEQDILKNNVLCELRRIADDNRGMKVMLATDSKNFAEYALASMPDLYLIPGEIRHIGTVDETGDGANIKLFLDCYMLSGAKKVYNIVGSGMWKSAFPEYAAKIGNCEFERVIM